MPFPPDAGAPRDGACQSLDVVDAAKIVDALGLPVIATTLEGTIVAWNPAAEKLYGHPAAEAIGRNVVDLLVPAPLGDSAAEIMRLVLGGEQWRGEFVVVRADGSELRTEIIDSPVVDREGRVIGVVGVGRDITEQVLTQQALVDSRDTLRLALAAGRLGTWRWDMAAASVHWDAQLEAIFGLEPGGFDGTFEMYRSSLHPDDRAHVLEVVQDALRTKSDYDVEHRVVWADGSVHWLQGRGSVTVDPTGQVTGTVGCVEDMTERVLRSRQADELSASLQAGLLPRLAAPAGVTVRSRYRPGEERLLLGGDFLDVAITPAGNVAFCIGDVAGHGAFPAAVGASLRAGWRALALAGDDPTAWLAGCSDLFAANDPPAELFVTMCTGFVSADRRRLVLLSTGHPLPILMGDGAARTLAVDSCPPLGLFTKEQLGAPATFDLPDDWSLLMFTDGLFEGHAAAGAAARLGPDRVEEWCRSLGPEPLDEAHLDGLLAFVETANGAPMVDDIAILVLAST